jgi:hypothetical protein
MLSFWELEEGYVKTGFWPGYKIIAVKFPLSFIITQPDTRVWPGY